MKFSFTCCTCLGENDRCFLCGGKGFVSEEDRRSEEADRQRTLHEGSGRQGGIGPAARKGSTKPGGSTRTFSRSIVIGASRARKRGYFDAFPHLASAREIEVKEEITLEADRSGSERIVKVRIASVSEYVRQARTGGRAAAKQRAGSRPVKASGSRANGSSLLKPVLGVRAAKANSGKKRAARRQPEGALQEALAAAGFGGFPEQRHTEHDATRDYAAIRDHGRFGSHPSHDDHDEK